MKPIVFLSDLFSLSDSSLSVVPVRFCQLFRQFCGLHPMWVFTNLQNEA